MNGSLGHPQFDALLALSQGRKVAPDALVDALDWARLHAYGERRVLFADQGDHFLIGSLDNPQRYEHSPTLALLHLLAVTYPGAWVDITDCAGGSATCSATRQRVNTALNRLVAPVLAAEFSNTARVQFKSDDGRLTGRYQRAVTSPMIDGHASILKRA